MGRTAPGSPTSRRAALGLRQPEPERAEAEKPDDVLFSGAGGRPPAPLPARSSSCWTTGRHAGRGFPAEVSVAPPAPGRRGAIPDQCDRRPAHRPRGGSWPTSASAAAGSVISQGKVEQILASKPEERRALVEERPGSGSSSVAVTAELKLARVGQDVARARDIEAEVKKRLRPLALQASAAQRRRSSAGRSPRSRRRSQPSTWPGSARRRGSATSAAAAASSSADGPLEALLAERHRAEEADAAGKRSLRRPPLPAQERGRRLELRHESAAALVESLRHAATRPRLPTSPSAAEPPPRCARK